MTPSFRLARLLRSERGATAALMAVMLTALIGLLGASVDMGVLYTARAQIQNAADAAALAAANTMLGADADNNAVVQTDVALDSARQYSSSNQAIGVSLNLKEPPGDDFTVGFWDQATGDFDPGRTGMSLSNPDDVTAVRVRVRRDGVANSPVATFFAGIVGLSAVDLRATSTAFLGWPGQVPAGTVDLPIAVLASAITSGDNPDCGKSLTFHSNGDQNAEWTTFFTWPSNNPNVDAYVTGELPVPALQVGDEINLTNGNLSNGTFNDLKQRFEANQTNGQWEVTLPVISAPGCGAIQGTISGFTTFVITEVRDAPYKDMTGFLKCGVVVPTSATGGGNYGSRATYSRLVR